MKCIVKDWGRKNRVGSGDFETKVKPQTMMGLSS